MEDSKRKVLAGWMILGLLVVGLFGLFAALLSLVNAYNYVGTGLCLLASAYAFSMVLKAYQ